jgi:hypothetical protein
LQNQFTYRKAELEADLEAEALPEALNFCWKRKRQKRIGGSGSDTKVTASASLLETHQI